ncbi:MAG: vitamin B12-dependent ribonucleotide reductase [Nitrospinae bacterium]|nr:vitamin B12-dependent ribonucleotide reductase [Nitrospinota bacterium]
MPLTENSIAVLVRRYLKKDEAGAPTERPEDMFRRVAENVAEADRRYKATDEEVAVTAEAFYQLMTNLEFMPNSPALMNAGRDLQQLSACFVLPIDDNMESIFETLKDAALIHKSGGGTGFSFSRLRSKNSRVRTTHGIASGPVSFMKVYDNATQEIKQGGTRRGANMGILRVDHPDIIDFITCKADGGIINFNISVAMTEGFMEAVERDEEYDLLDPNTQEVVKRLSARKVFDLIVNLAWKTGDPGIVFLDRINRDNPTPLVAEIEATNPCGEQPLLPYESCNLGSINLAKMLRTINGTWEFDWGKLRRTVHRCILFLDNIIDMNNYPLPQIEEMTRGNRKIGLGVMGFADALIMLGIPYNSERALECGEEIMSFVQTEAKAASVDLASRRGNYPFFVGSTHEADGLKLMRHTTVTTIAPTGTISIIACCSSGIEPLFAVSYVRTVMDGTRLVEVNPLFLEVATERGFYSEELMAKIAERGSVVGLSEVPEDVQRLFVTSHDLEPMDHIKMQAAFQKHTDNAVSKTVNMRHDAPPEEVREVYRYAYENGCKGVTVFRDGCKGGEQVLSIGTTPKAEDALEDNGEPALGTGTTPKARPDVTRGTTRSIMTGCGKMYVTINEDEHGVPFELFNSIGKAGGCASAQSEAIGRLVSLALRSGVNPEVIVKHLKGISCHLPVWQNGMKILSCADAVGKSLEMYLVNKGASAGASPGLHQMATPLPLSATDGLVRSTCPDCGGGLVHEEGCVVCHGCGYSECF